MKTALLSIFSRFSAATPDEKNPRVLPDVIVCEEGEAKGHGYYLSRKFLEQIVKAATGATIKVRCDHPEEGKSGRLQSIVGEAEGFHLSEVDRDGKKVACVRANVHLLDLPIATHILQLAKQAAHLFGMSLDFGGRAGKRLAGGLREITCDVINALDFVEQPAAASSLFSASVDSRPTNINRTPAPSSTHSLNDMKLSLEVLARFGLPADATEEQVNAKLASLRLAEEAPAKEETREEKMARLRTEFRAKLADMEEGETLSEEFDALFAEEEPAPAVVDEDEEPAPSEKLSARVERIARRSATVQLTRLLSKAGIAPRLSVPATPSGEQPQQVPQDKLTEEEAKIADKLGIKHDVYLAELNKHNIRLGK